MNAIIDKATHHRPKNLIKQIAATEARVWREQSRGMCRSFEGRDNVLHPLSLIGSEPSEAPIRWPAQPVANFWKGCHEKDHRYLRSSVRWRF